MTNKAYLGLATFFPEFSVGLAAEALTRKVSMKMIGLVIWVW